MGLFFFFFLLFVRFLPAIAMSEVKGVIAGSHGHDADANHPTGGAAHV
jgi:hypothetical protein